MEEIHAFFGETERRRCEIIANYIIENHSTVRAAAANFGISKSTVYKDVTDKLSRENHTLYLRVKDVLEVNKAQRHIRGGEATRRKYLECGEHLTTSDKPAKTDKKRFNSQHKLART